MKKLFERRAQFVLLAAALLLSGGGTAAASRVCYETHVQDFGWSLGIHCDGQMGGTTGQAKRLEAITVWTPDIDGGVCYRVHVSGSGWLSVKCDKAVAGTIGQERAIESFSIWLTNAPANMTVNYKCHQRGTGWIGPKAQGFDCGVTGQAKRLEAIEVAVVGDGVSPVWQF